MKYNRIVALALLFSLLLSLPALAAAGDGSDPLISRSYADGTFRVELSAALDALCGRAVTRFVDDAPADAGWKMLSCAAGDTVTLRDGQQLVLLSGGVRLSIVRGKLLNCTLGRESIGGDARIGHRYVVWDDAEIRVDCAMEAVVACSAGAESTAAVLQTGLTELPPAPDDGALPFTDVPQGIWYYDDLRSAVRRGLVNGMTPTTYAPQGELTLAQAVKLAACMYQLWYDGAVTLTNADDGRAWYVSYAEYALAHGIMDELPESGWNAAISRAYFVRIFYRALPASAYTAINDIPADAIPDVKTGDDAAEEIYAFYAAGILTGYAESSDRAAHAFGAESAITRAEVATIMNRMFTPEARVAFSLG